MTQERENIKPQRFSWKLQKYWQLSWQKLSKTSFSLWSQTWVESRKTHLRGRRGFVTGWSQSARRHWNPLGGVSSSLCLNSRDGIQHGSARLVFKLAVKGKSWHGLTQCSQKRQQKSAKWANLRSEVWGALSLVKWEDRQNVYPEYWYLRPALWTCAHPDSFSLGFKS